MHSSDCNISVGFRMSWKTKSLLNQGIPYSMQLRTDICFKMIRNSASQETKLYSKGNELDIGPSVLFQRKSFDYRPSLQFH